MRLSKYLEDDFYVYKYNLKIKKNQTRESISGLLKMLLVVNVGSLLFIWAHLSKGYGDFFLGFCLFGQ